MIIRSFRAIFACIHECRAAMHTFCHVYRVCCHLHQEPVNDIGGPRMTGTVLEKVFGDKTCHVVTLSINPNAATGYCAHMFSTAKAPLHSSHKCPIQWPHRLGILWTKSTILLSSSVILIIFFSCRMLFVVTLLLSAFVCCQVTSNEGSKWDAFDKPVWRQAQRLFGPICCFL